MKKTKLIQGLSLLSDQEWERFRQMVSSPYFDAKPQSKALLSYLTPLGPDFKKAPQEKDAYEAMYPNKLFDKQKLKDGQSYLFKSLMQFMALEELQVQPYMSDSLSLRRLRKMRGERLFQLQRNALVRKLEGDVAEPTDAWRDAWLDLHEEADQVAAQTDGRPSAEHLEAALTALDARYATRKLRAMCELQNRYNIHGGEMPAVWADEAVHEALPNEMSRFAPAVSLYEKILIFLKDVSRDDVFEEFSNELAERAPMLPRMEARALYTHAQNFCIGRINKGNSSYLSRIFDLYRQQLDNGLILDNGFLSHGNFTNIITTALRLKEISWVDTFMPEYRKKLPVHQRDTVYQYNLANFHYQQGQLRQAMRELQTVEFADGFYALSAKLLLCRVYFELEEDELLSYLMAAFKRHLQRSKGLSVRHSLPYREFLRFLKKLQNMRERAFLLKKPAFIQRKKSLHDTITQAENLALRSWLITQVEALEA